MDNRDEKKDFIQGLFPQPFGFYHMPREFTQSEIAWIMAQEANANVNQGGNLASKDFYVFNNPALSALKAFCHEKLNVFFQEVFQPREPAELYITQSWINVSRKGQHHHLHIHQNSILSGVLYIQAKDDNITFLHTPNNIFRYLKINPRSLNPFNVLSREFKVQTGQLVLFHSNTPHAVKTLEHDNIRISLSFNSFIRGHLGDSTQLDRLEL